jgi:hypothetical protein
MLPRWAGGHDALFDIADKFFQSTSYNWARQISKFKESQNLPSAELSFILGGRQI